MKQHIPNVLTYARLVLCLVMFAGFGFLAAGVVGRPVPVPADLLTATIVATFVLAAVTDFFDGYLARKWGVVSMTGAILDPIADKVLVCGAILGICAVATAPEIVMAGGVILFREFAISALREVLAPKGIKLPVTFLAKTKTTLQLVAITALMVTVFWRAWDPDGFDGLDTALGAAKGLFLFAAVVTVWTGFEYAMEARKALRRDI